MTGSLIPCVGGPLDEKVIAHRGVTFSVGEASYRLEKFARPACAPHPFYVCDDMTIPSAVRLIVQRGLL